MSAAAEDYRFVAATVDDLPTIRQIVGEVLEEYDLALDLDGTDTDIRDAEGFQGYLLPGGHFLLVLDPRDKVVGTGGFYPKDWHTAEVRKMYLLPEARGQGLGRRLLDELLAESRRHGYEDACLETNSRLTGAIRLYESYGFRQRDDAPRSDRCDRYYVLGRGSAKRLFGRGPTAAPPPYRVPRRFGMTGMIGIPVAVALYLGVLRLLDATGWMLVFWIGLPAVVAAAQAFLHRGRKPRLASMEAGGVYCTVWLLAVSIVTQNPYAAICCLLPTVGLGATSGYLTGAVIGGAIGLARGLQSVDATEEKQEETTPLDDADPFSDAEAPLRVE